MPLVSRDRKLSLFLKMIANLSFWYYLQSATGNESKEFYILEVKVHSVEPIDKLET